MEIKKERAVLLFKIGVFGICYYIFVELAGLALPCPIKAMAKGRIECCGCRISRMCVSMARLEFSEAFGYNQAVFSLIPIWTVCLCLWVFGKGERFNKIIVIMSIIILLAFGVIRNII